MLDSLRKSAGSWVAKILFGLLILSFGVWGIGDVVRSGASGGAAIAVGDIEVGPGYVRSQFERQVDQLRRVLGPEFTMEQARSMGLLDTTIRSIVAQASLDMAARDLGITVSDDAVRTAVARQQAFQTDDGTFDRDLFRRVLSANGLSEDRYLASLRQDLVRERIAQAIAGNGAAPEVMAQTLFRFQQEGRVADVLRIDASALPLDAEPTDEALREIYDQNTDRFTAPEYRGLTAVLLTADQLMDRIEVSDEAISDYYQANADQFTRPETRTVQQVIVGDAETAKTIAAKARTAGLAAAAQEAGVGAPLDMGPVAAEGLPPEAADAVFALDAGGVSDPVESPLGFHVFAVEAVTPSEQQPLETVRDDIRQRIARERSVDALYDAAADLEDTLGGGASLEEAAQQLDLKLVQVPAVSVDGETPTGTPADLPADAGQTVLEKAFTMQQGEESRLEDFTNGSFIVRLDSVTPPQPRPFEEVRDEVVALWTARQRQQKAETLAKDLLQRAGGPVNVAALTEGNRAVSYRRTPALTRSGASRDGQQAQLDEPMLRRLFALQPGEATWAPVAGGAVVLRLEQVLPADPAAGDAALTALERDLRSATGEDLLTETTQAFANRYGVEVNRGLIDRAF